MSERRIEPEEVPQEPEEEQVPPEEEEKEPERACGTMDYHRGLVRIDPEYRDRRYQIEEWTQQYIAQRAEVGFDLRSGIVIIPVVVHVVYHTATENISDAQINGQIARLNQDYRKQNADVTSAPAVFQSVAADCRIQFQLAARDPDCNPTTGITRTYTDVTAFSYDRDAATGPERSPVKFASTGGADAWPRDKYLNIWVCNLSGRTMGYSAFPGRPADEDGVVIDYMYFGDTGTATSPYDLGRTATHEIGHWLNLLHIWGDDRVACHGSDEVADTPNQAGYNTGCPTFPHESCSNGPDGDMFMNYMDYVDDSCMVMFTAGQSARMDATLYGSRSDIVASDAVVPPPETTADLWSKDMADDVGSEPNTISEYMYKSDDIWVRRQDDGIADQEHQNPQYRPSGPPNYVYVRVRNLGCGASASGTVKLYWAKASTGLAWPAPWDGSVTTPAPLGGLIDAQPTGSVPANGSVILTFEWDPPNPADYASFGGDKNHFCLLSRIETSSTAPYGMTFSEGTNLSTNVENNNNIVWKNVSVMEADPDGSRVAWVTVGTFADEMAIAKLVFTVPPKPEPSVFDWGKVFIDLDHEFFGKWKDMGGEGEGIEVPEEGTLMIAEPGAWILVEMQPLEFSTFRVRVEPFDKEVEGANVFMLDVTQRAAEMDDMVVGGQTLVIKTTGKPEYKLGEIPTLRFDGCDWVEKG